MQRYFCTLCETLDILFKILASIYSTHINSKYNFLKISYTLNGQHNIKNSKINFACFMKTFANL